MKKLKIYMFFLALASFSCTSNIALENDNTVNFAGDWNWVCCDQKYSGTLVINQSGKVITGQMKDKSDVESLIAGRIDSLNVLTFDRTLYGQRYILTPVSESIILGKMYLQNGGSGEVFLLHR